MCGVFVFLIIADPEGGSWHKCFKKKKKERRKAEVSMTQCTVGVIGYILERFTLYWRSEQKKKKKCMCKCVSKSQMFT